MKMEQEVGLGAGGTPDLLLFMMYKLEGPPLQRALLCGGKLCWN